MRRQFNSALRHRQEDEEGSCERRNGSGTVAQRLEQAAHNRLVDGSNPSSPTRVAEKRKSVYIAFVEVFLNGSPRVSYSGYYVTLPRSRYGFDSRYPLKKVRPSLYGAVLLFCGEEESNRKGVGKTPVFQSGVTDPPAGGEG